MKQTHNLLVDVLLTPSLVTDFSNADWDLLVRQANHSRLLGRVDYRLADKQVPEGPAAHLEAARRVTQRQRQAVRFEVAQIRHALAPLGVPVVLLKGAAYVAAGLAPAQGRIFSDIDILVPKTRLEEVEQAMLLHGWVGGHHDAYDEEYYRNWMHEIPPLRHVKRQTVVDVHHTILPETCRAKPDPDKLMSAANPVSEHEDVFTLSSLDIVLHSATHLFYEGELEHGLRDLVDLDALLRHFSKDETFWDRLIERAAEMDLRRPLYYALRYTQRILQTPVPDATMRAAAAIGKPPTPLAWLMDALFGRALMPDHSSCDDALTPLARWLLYIRSHYLRMPFHLLLPHLVRKAIKKRFSPVQADVPKLEDN